MSRSIIKKCKKLSFILTMAIIFNIAGNMPVLSFAGIVEENNPVYENLTKSAAYAQDIRNNTNAVDVVSEENDLDATDKKEDRDSFVNDSMKYNY